MMAASLLVIDGSEYHGPAVFPLPRRSVWIKYPELSVRSCGWENLFSKRVAYQFNVNCVINSEARFKTAKFYTSVTENVRHPQGQYFLGVSFHSFSWRPWRALNRTDDGIPILSSYQCSSYL
jgi:hypothetical protein